MTYKEFIKFSLQDGNNLSCNELTTRISGYFCKKSRYLSGGVSSILAKMVKNNELEVDETRKGLRGGKIYKLKINIL